MTRTHLIGLVFFVSTLGCAPTATIKPQAKPTPLGVLEIHPIFIDLFTTTEHHDGQLSSLGDALGSDCVIQELVNEDERTWLRAYKGEGAQNEDWYGWRRPVLAPIDGEVIKLNINPTTNTPGAMTPGIASYLLIKRDDGVHVMLAHVREPSVKVGDKVIAGQQIARMGNNGYSRHPHIHLGAWRDKTPLQLRFDLKALAKLRAAHPIQVKTP